MKNRIPYWVVTEIDRRPWLLMLLVTITCILAPSVGGSSSLGPSSVRLIWPTAGLSIAATLMFGLRVLPAVAGGTFIAIVAGGAPWEIAVAMSLASIAECVIAESLWTRTASDHRLRSVRDVMVFAGGVGVGAAVVGSAVGTLSACVLGDVSWSEGPWRWVVSSVVDASWILFVAPAILTWSYEADEKYGRARAIELAVVLGLLAVASELVFGGFLNEGYAHPLSLICFPFVIWGAVRFGPRGASLASVVAALVAVINTSLGIGPFALENHTLTLVYLYGLAGAATVTGLMLGASVAGYRTLTRELADAHESLEARVADRTNTLREELAEHQRTSSALRDSEERYRRLTQAITDYIYVVSFLDGHPVRTTHAPTCVAVTGYTSEEFTANPFLWLHMVHPDDRELVLTLTSQILSTHKSVSIDHRIVRKDGVVRWIKNTTVPTFSTDGVLLSYDGLIQDITDRKLAEEAVRASEQRFRAVFDSAAIGITITSLDGTLLRCNPALERMLGYRAGELDGQPSKRIAHPDEYQRHKDDVRWFITGVQKDHGVVTERRFLRKDGSMLWGRLTSSVLRDAEGNPQCGVGIVEDITARKAAEQERERLLRQVQEAMADLKTLSGLVPICSSCKKIRDDHGAWTAVEEYLTARTGAQFTHGICPDCLREFYPEVAEGYAELLAANGQRHAGDGIDQGSARG
jgi:PAS domain S-box-containing protein